MYVNVVDTYSLIFYREKTYLRKSVREWLSLRHWSIIVTRPLEQQPTISWICTMGTRYCIRVCISIYFGSSFFFCLHFSDQNRKKKTFPSKATCIEIARAKKNYCKWF